MKSTTTRRKAATPAAGLRCKPGQLAMITCPPGAGFSDNESHLIGLIIRVKSLIPHMHSGVPCWTYEGRVHRTRDGLRAITAIADFVLLPIPDDLLGDGDALECAAPGVTAAVNSDGPLPVSATLRPCRA